MECRLCGKSNFELTIQKNHNDGTSRYRRCIDCQVNVGSALSEEFFNQLSRELSVVDLGSWDGSKRRLGSTTALLKSTLFKNEKELQDWFYEVFAEWFYIAKEVPGKHLVEGSPVRIDFMLFPKAELRGNKFSAEWFGVEVKLFPNHEKGLSAPSKALWQAVSYNDSEFYLNQSESSNFDVSKNDNGIKPSYTMLFSNRSFKKGNEEYLYQDGKESKIKFDYIMRTIQAVGLYAKVGTINIIESIDNSNLKRWNFNFGSEIYYSFVREVNQSYRQKQFELHNETTITKKRVGHQ